MITSMKPPAGALSICSETGGIFIGEGGHPVAGISGIHAEVFQAGLHIGAGEHVVEVITGILAGTAGGALGHLLGADHGGLGRLDEGHVGGTDNQGGGKNLLEALHFNSPRKGGSGSRRANDRATRPGAASSAAL